MEDIRELKKKKTALEKELTQVIRDIDMADYLKRRQVFLERNLLDIKHQINLIQGQVKIACRDLSCNSEFPISDIAYNRSFYGVVETPGYWTCPKCSRLNNVDPSLMEIRESFKEVK